MAHFASKHEVRVSDIQHDLQVSARVQHESCGYQAAELTKVSDRCFEAVPIGAQQFRKAIDRETGRAPAASNATGAEKHRPKREILAQDRLVGIHHRLQLGFPHGLVSFDALQTDLAMPLRVVLADPYDAAEGLVAATLDRDNLARLLCGAESDDASAVLGNVVGAGHFQMGLMLVVPAGDTNRKRNVNALGRSIGGNEFAGAVTHNLCAALCSRVAGI